MIIPRVHHSNALGVTHFLLGDCPVYYSSPRAHCGNSEAVKQLDVCPKGQYLEELTEID